MILSLVMAGLVMLSPVAPQEEVAPRFPAAVETEASRIFNSTMSPFCPGLLIANCPSPGAADLKEQIRIQLAAGAPPDSVRAMLRAAYGSEVDAVPPAEGFGLVAWLMPAVVLLGGGVLVVWWLRGRGTAGPAPARPSEPLEPEAAARLERELAEL